MKLSSIFLFIFYLMFFLFYFYYQFNIYNILDFYFFDHFSYYILSFFDIMILLVNGFLFLKFKKKNTVVATLVLLSILPSILLVVHGTLIQAQKPGKLSRTEKSPFDSCIIQFYDHNEPLSDPETYLTLFCAGHLPKTLGKFSMLSSYPDSSIRWVNKNKIIFSRKSIVFDD